MSNSDNAIYNNNNFDNLINSDLFKLVCIL